MRAREKCGVGRQTVIYRKLNTLAPMNVGKRVAVEEDRIYENL